MSNQKKKYNVDFFSHAKESLGEEKFLKASKRGMQKATELRLKMARESLGLNQTDLEGLTQPEVSKIESRKDVKVSTLDKYAHALGMKVKIVLIPEDEEEDTDSIAVYG